MLQLWLRIGKLAGMAIYSTITAAAELGVDKSTISRHAAKLGVGTRLGANLVFSAADLAALRKSISQARAGNPNFVPGNRFGKPPKKGKKTS